MKKLLFICIFITLIIFSLIYPAQIIDASRTGILVWFQQILPALLPFTILSTLLLKTNLLKSISKGGNLLAIGITMCCGFIFGFPIGAKLASDFYNSKLLSKRQATILSITANNFSPIYVCGFVLPALFSSKVENYNTLVYSTYTFVYLLPLCIAAILLICTYHQEQRYIEGNVYEKFELNMQFLDNSISLGFQTLIKLCGYIVIFSVFTKMITILLVNPPLHLQILIENLEITNGIQLLSSSNLSQKYTYIMAIQILTLGGLSGIAQTNSIFCESKLSIYKYIIGKVTLSLLLTLLTVIYVSYFNRF